MFELKIDITDAELGDAEQIYQLSVERSKDKDPEKGFLISDFTKKDYEKFIKNPKNFFLVARQKDLSDAPVIGFLLAYPCTEIKTEIKNETGVDIQMKKRMDEPFVLIKQVCVSKKFSWTPKKWWFFKRKKKIGSRLYNRLFQLIAEGKTRIENPRNNNENFNIVPQNCGCIAAIVNQPRNLASIYFHEARQFQWLTDIEPVDKDGKTEPIRSVWCRFPYSGKLSLGFLDYLFFKKNTVVRYPFLKSTKKEDILDQDKSERINHLFIKSQTAAALYMHEDNLNWKKIGMLATFMAGFLTAFSYLLKNKEQVQTGEGAVIVLLTLFFGLLINAVFYTKIQSGKMFFDSHKKSLRRYETMLYWLNTDLSPLLKGPLYRKSITFKMISYLSRASVLLYGLCSLKLIFMAWDQWMDILRSMFHL